MPQSLANVLVHIVFSTKDRIPFLKDQIFRDELHAQLGGTSKSLNCPPIIVGGVDDHIHMLASQIKWFNENGGLSFSAGRSARSAETLYTWAENSGFATPFVSNSAERSNVVGTIDFADSIDAGVIAKVLRANGVVDTDNSVTEFQNRYKEFAFYFDKSYK